ncbi:MAG: hypothetical protein HN689_03855 [Euryarchaeota archaeon]|nr:hypothetical protein [Euryarchaeota archaeon]
MKNYTALMLVILVSAHAIPINQITLLENDSYQVNSKATGVDLSVTDVDFSYPNNNDEQKYQKFSSNYPIAGFTKPEYLFAIDAVKDVEIELTFFLSNSGSNDAANVGVNVLVIHNEYIDFNLHNITNTIGTVRAQSDITSTVKFIPTYSGNHTLIVSPFSSLLDDNPSNDAYTSTFTVASKYYNCNDLFSWTVGAGWAENTDTFLSEASACHYGNGQFSTYSANANSDLITPILDMSDAISNPTRTNGITFFHTGSLASGDYIRLYGKSQNNAWIELISMTGTTDNTFTDSANWNTFSLNHAGAFSPLVPTSSQLFHTNSQYKFSFTSDSVNNDIGFWMDDIVIVYDQEAKQSEFDISVSGLSVTKTVPGSWGKAVLELTNSGNISEIFTPSMQNLPAEWQYYFSHQSGVSISEDNGVLVEKGETKIIELNYQPKSSESAGLFPIGVTLSSVTYGQVSDTINVQLEVEPDRIPEFSESSTSPRCSPGNTCTYSAYVMNIGGASDVFDLSLSYQNLPIGWSVAFAWNQPTSIYVQPGILTEILLTYTVAQDAVPDSIGIFQIRAQSQNDSSRTDTLDVTATASMVSDASVYLQEPYIDTKWSVNPGELVTIGFEIINNASVQDIFSTSIDTIGFSDWNVVNIVPEVIYLNSNSTGTFIVTLESPESAQHGDNCPSVVAEIISIRSGQNFQSETHDNLQINQVNDVSVLLIDSPASIIPGIINNFSLEIENLGNGPVSSSISVDNIPSSWNWWLEDELGQRLNEIQLSERSELDYLKNIQLKIDVPAGVEPNTEFTISVSIAITANSEDINPLNNVITKEIFTGTVRNIILSTQESPIYTGVGNSTKLESYIFNLGNIDEREVKVRAQITSQDYFEPIESYFTIGTIGITFDFDIFHTITLEKNSSRKLGIDIVLPNDVPMDATISILFEIQYHDNGFITKSQNVDLVVNHVRKFTTIYGHSSISSIDDYGKLWINNTIESTTNEILTIGFNTPPDWNLLCQSSLVNNSEVTIESPFIASIIRTPSTYCEVLNNGMILEGKLTISVSDSSGKVISQTSISYTFQDKTSDSTSLSVTMIGGMSLLLLVLIVVLMYGIRRVTNDRLETSESKPVNGPPISGPPISNQIIDQTTSSVTKEGASPPLPENGLPQGWTMEQWKYYGQQYLEMTNRQ